MELDWVETVGYAGTLFTICAYGAKYLVPLRILAIMSSISFLTYGLLAESYPLVVMEVVLLPINSFRLYELLADRRRRAAAAGLQPQSFG